MLTKNKCIKIDKVLYKIILRFLQNNDKEFDFLISILKSFQSLCPNVIKVLFI